METIRNLNNHGISMLIAGDTHSAIVDFTGALKAARQTLQMNHPQDSTSTEYEKGTSSATATTLSLDHCMIRSCDVASKCASTTSLTNHVVVVKEEAAGAGEDDDRSAFLYRQGIFLPSDVTATAVATSAVNGMTISVIVVFNLALAHHQRANECGAPRSPLLQKTIKLYELAFTLYQDRCSSTAATTAAADLLFLMALMNNLAVAKHALQDMVAAGQCFQHLLSILMVVVDTSCTGDHNNNSTAAAANHSWLCEGFLRNTSYLVSPHITAPAA